jgi:ribose transport system permease protein
MKAAAASRTPQVNVKELVKRYTLRFGLPSILFVQITVFGVLEPSFFSDITSLYSSTAISIILFLGLTWFFAVGEIDVSFVSIAALSNMVCAGLVSSGYGWPVAVAAAMVSSLIVGLVNGALIANLGLPSLVITIGTGGAASALAAAIGKGASIALTTPGFLDPLFTKTVANVPMVALLALALYAAAWFAQERLTLGQYIYAVAQNRHAVVEAGIAVKRLLMLLALLLALCSGLAGVLLASNLASGQPWLASSYFLDGLTSVLLGSTMLRLGKPNVIGTAVGSLVLAVMVRGGALLGWTDSNFQMMKGGLLLLALVVVYWTNARK